ncbi:caspase family protein [Aureispira]|nr:caspase family protein [Aureispira sp.]
MYKLIAIIFIISISLVNSTNAQTKGCIEGNCKNGWGIFEYFVGDIYQGRYEGYFSNSKRNGKGIFYYSNDDKYQGSWVNGRPDGLGAKISKGGKIKSGIWSKGKLTARLKKELIIQCLSGTCTDGLGKSKDNYGNIYKGTFLNGQYSGYGEMTYNNGERFKGIWQKGVPHGQGSYYFRNGHVNTGKFESGKYAENKMKIWALIVGVADYPYFNNLSYTTQDAKLVYSFLRSIEGGAVPENQIKLLLDNDATAFNIMNTAADLYEQSDSNDLILFYFAGHGKNGAFLPSDYDGNEGNLLHHGLINSLLKDSPAKYKLCAIDACHSGSFDINLVLSYKDYLNSYKTNGEDALVTLTRSTKSIRERIKDYYNSFNGIKSGLAVIMSSASEEISLEANKLKQGVFSYYFIQAMKGAANIADENGKKDNLIDITELFQFIEKNVRTFTFGFQHPLIYGQYDKHMPIGLLKR